MAQYYGAPPSAYYNPAQFLGPNPLREAIPAIRNLGDDLKEQSKYEDSQAAYANQQMVRQQQFAKELAEEKDKNLKAYETAVANRKASIRKAEAEQRDRENKLAFDKEKNEQDKAKAAEEKRIKEKREKIEDKAWDFIQKLDPELGYRDRIKAVGQAGFADIPSVKAQMEREEKIWLARQKNWRTGQVVKGRAGKGKLRLETPEDYQAWLNEYSKAAKLGGDIIGNFQENVPMAEVMGKPGAVGSKDLSETARMRDTGIDFAIRFPHLFEPGGMFYGQSPSDLKRGAVLGGQNLPAPQAAPSVNTRPKPPEKFINRLNDAKLGVQDRSNPNDPAIVKFEERFGKGSAARYLK